MMTTATSPVLRRRWRPGPLPGFGLSLGITLSWLSAIVLVPLAALIIHGSGLGWSGLWAAIDSPRVGHAFRVTFLLSLFAASIALVGGLISAWVLVRYRFPGRRLLDLLIDLPFALPTAVAGISLTALLAPNGWIGSLATADSWIGSHLTDTGAVATSWIGGAIEAVFGDVFTPHGLRLAFSQLGILAALIFIGIPFVVRTVQPVLAGLERDQEEAAASLGASRWRTIRTVILPEVVPAALTGFAMAFARAIGEYGSVVFIAGSLPMATEIVPHLIVIRLEQYDIPGAIALGVAMLAASFALLLAINLLQRWAARATGSAA